MKFSEGMQVKIDDIGTLATCVAVKRTEIELVLEGERFWIAKRFCKPIRK